MNLSIDERLGTLDPFGGRKQVIPAEASGPLRRYRNYVYFLLLILFLVLPWIHIQSTQALLLDIPNRKFEIFGARFFSHDAPLVFFIAMLFALGLVTATALWGRVWCGWACPQTVFIDFVYRRIEIWILGNYIQRRKLNLEPLSFRKVALISFKWFSFFVVSFVIAHSLFAYFVGSKKLIEMMQMPPGQNWTYFVCVFAITGLLLFNFGWFREQFCIIMCPYGRFQNVLMDQQSMAILYDEKRGEPRRSLKTDKAGDCISCNRCVEVCPTGIDIRNGIQLECIFCTACVDACNEIMTKVNKPLGLISFRKISDSPRPLLKSRTTYYVAGMSLLLVGLIFALLTRQPFSAEVLRSIGSPYQLIGNGSISNHFKIHVVNQSSQDHEYRLFPSEPGLQLTHAQKTYVLEAGKSLDIHFFVLFPQDLLNNERKMLFHLNIEELRSGRILSQTQYVLGP